MKIIIVLLLLLSHSLHAQDFEFFPGAQYDPAVPTLRGVLGFDWAEKITTHEELTRYLRALADYAPQAELRAYGATWEDRTLQYLLIGSPGTMARLEDIRRGVQTLADPRGVQPAEIERLLNELPVIVWLSYGVHGNETSGPDAALLTAYHLIAAQQDTLTASILRNALVILDPEQNPDGRDRFVQYFRQTRGRWPDPFSQAAEHQEVWPGGRTNHYLFDLNRDWIILSQQETRDKVRAYLDWQPQVFVDLHEMGGNMHYYFPPTAPPVNPEFTGDQVRWIEQFGRNNARWFDRMHFSYFTGEVFDSFYPGYGEGWPAFHGAIGMTYEESAVRGLVRKGDDETTLYYREAVQRHFTTSLATLALAASQRASLLRHFTAYRQSAISAVRASGVRAYLLPPGDDPALTRRLALLLVDQGIEVRQSASAFTQDRATDIARSAPARREFPAGTYIIDLAQPAGRLASTLLMRDTPMDSAFVREQIRRQAKRLDHQIYDVTAWSLPLLFNAACYHTRAAVTVPTVPLDRTTTPGVVTGGPAPLAYCVPWNSAAAGFAAQLHQQGIRCFMTDKAFALKGTPFPAGSLIIKVRDNPPDLYERLQALSSERGITITATETGWVDEGINFGSDQVHFMPKPVIAMAWNIPTSASAAGWTRYAMEQMLAYPVTALRTEYLKDTPLKDFNVLILPNGGDYAEALGDGGAQRIRQWVQDGGTLITIGAATHWATGKKAGLLSTRRELKGGVPDIEQDEKTEKPAAGAPADTFTLQVAILPERELPEQTAGAVVQGTLDTEHWLAFGYGATLHVLAAGRDLFTPLKLDKGRNVGLYAPHDSLTVSGFVWDATGRQMAQKAWLMHQPHQQGHVVAFAEDPNFRAATAGMQLLFMNAILFGPAH